jgi:uncharacterized protein YndB with AHSA1/START domain
MSTGFSESVVQKSVVLKLDRASAFQVWTEQIAAWWPKNHSMSGDPATQVFLEGEVGGRFYERTRNGDEYDWGAVQVWDPPERLSFTWYLGSGGEMPTRVDVHFTPLDGGSTRIDLEHRGPELVAELWWERKDLFSGAWDKVLAELAAFTAARETES